MPVRLERGPSLITELSLVATDTRQTVVGAIRINGGKATFTNPSVEQLFRNIQKQKKADKSDQSIFDLLAKGWSNGPRKIIPAERAARAGG